MALFPPQHCHFVLACNFCAYTSTEPCKRSRRETIVGIKKRERKKNKFTCHLPPFRHILYLFSYLSLFLFFFLLLFFTGRLCILYFLTLHFEAFIVTKRTNFPRVCVARTAMYRSNRRKKLLRGE